MPAEGPRRLALPVQGIGEKSLRIRWPDGQSPGAALVQGADGAFYGTTLGGGTNSQGTVFKLNGDGTGYRILRSFSGTGGDGALPGTLLEASDGWLYGVTASGGSTNAGTLFKMTTEGAGNVILFSFPGGAAGGPRPFCLKPSTAFSTVPFTMRAGFMTGSMAPYSR